MSADELRENGSVCVRHPTRSACVYSFAPDSHHHRQPLRNTGTLYSVLTSRSLSSPMLHRIFLVEDLVILIIEELTRGSYFSFKSDMVSLALTCRALEAPVLSMLWARQTTLSSLIRVLPPNILKYTLHASSEESIWSFLTEEIVRNSDVPEPCFVFQYLISC